MSNTITEATKPRTRSRTRSDSSDDEFMTLESMQENLVKIANTKKAAKMKPIVEEDAIQVVEEGSPANPLNIESPGGSTNQKAVQVWNELFMGRSMEEILRGFEYVGKDLSGLLSPSLITNSQ